ncbi:MAG: hypothetical protein C0392_16215 [Syntrophus sp. (in: bacteria)]|nr:hypothetical protein [Syntrophus sp. (in: bacteria)]
MEEHANDFSMMSEPSEREINENIGIVPIFINGKKALACITLKEACARGILSVTEVSKYDDLPRSELRDRMKRQFCELLILEKIQA